MIVFGRHAYGTVESGAGSRIATLFFHVCFVPLVPLYSFVEVWVPGIGEVVFRREQFDRMSLVRGWVPGVMLLLGLILGANLRGLFIPTWVTGIGVGALGTAIVFYRIPAEVGARAANLRNLRSRWIGAPVELAWRIFDTRETETRLRAFLDERGRGFNADYRDAAGASKYRRAALDPSMVDSDYLVAAAVFAEIEAERDPAQADRAREAAEQIWSKLLSLYPEANAAGPWYSAFENHDQDARNH